MKSESLDAYQIRSLNPKVLYELYKVQKRTIKEIAKSIGVSTFLIGDRLWEYGIKRKGHKFHNRKEKISAAKNKKIIWDKIQKKIDEDKK